MEQITQQMVKAAAGTGGRWLSPSWKPAPVRVRWKHDQDCRMEGCPGHVAIFEYNSTSDTLMTQFDDQREERIYLGLTEMWLLERWAAYLRTEDAGVWEGCDDGHADGQGAGEAAPPPSAPD